MAAEIGQFKKSDADRIREAFAAHDGTLTCPMCGGELKITPYAGGGTIAPVFEVRCGPCALVTFAARGR